MLTGWERPSHWLVLAVVVVVLFGYKKLPDMSRSVGRSLRIFKTEMKGMSEDDSSRSAAEAPAPPAPPAPPVEAAPVAPPAAPPSMVKATPVNPPAAPYNGAESNPPQQQTQL